MLLSHESRTTIQPLLSCQRVISITLCGALFLIIVMHGYVSSIVLNYQRYSATALGTLLALVLAALYGLRGQHTQRQARAAAQTYAHDLAYLEQALRRQQQEFETMQRLLTERYETLQHKLVTVGELGVGVVPLAPGTLIVPLHGDTTLDAAHAVRARLLAAYTLQEAHTLVLDVQCSTCRPAVARVLVQTLESISGLGVHVIICGSSELLRPLAPQVECLPHLHDVLARLK